MMNKISSYKSGLLVGVIVFITSACGGSLNDTGKSESNADPTGKADKMDDSREVQPTESATCARAVPGIECRVEQPNTGAARAECRVEDVGPDWLTYQAAIVPAKLPVEAHRFATGYFDLGEFDRIREERKSGEASFTFQVVDKGSWTSLGETSAKNLERDAFFVVVEPVETTVPEDIRVAGFNGPTPWLEGRTFRFDSDGKLKSLSGEKTFEINEPNLRYWPVYIVNPKVDSGFLGLGSEREKLVYETEQMTLSTTDFGFPRGDPSTMSDNGGSLENHGTLPPTKFEAKSQKLTKNYILMGDFANAAKAGTGNPNDELHGYLLDESGMRVAHDAYNTTKEDPGQFNMPAPGYYLVNGKNLKKISAESKHVPANAEANTSKWECKQ